MRLHAAAAMIAACCVAFPAAAQTISPATDLYDEPHYERVGHLIYGYQRLLGSIDGQARADLARHAPRELNAHLARVAAEYDAIMQEHGDVPDARLEAALREVRAVSAELAAWRKTQAQ